MIEASAIIVTRGDHQPTVWQIADDLSHVFNEVLIWDNLVAPIDLKVFGRYAAAGAAANNLLYFQDDDVVIDAEQLWKLACQHPSYAIVANMPEGRRLEYLDGVALLGFGSIVKRTAIHQAFTRYLAHFPFDDLFLRECDRVFTGLTEMLRMVEVPFDHTSFADGPGRMCKEERHLADLTEIRRRIQYIKSFEERTKL